MRQAIHFAIVALLSFSFLLVAALADSNQQEQDSGLKELAGTWEVMSADATAGQKLVFPVESGLTAKGSRVTVRGNELISDGKIVATLTTDFSSSGLNVEKQVHITRQPIMFTLPDGQGILCAYRIQNGYMEIVHPHTMGRVGGGSWLSLKQSETK